jgi:hypothetical protein
VVEFLVAHGADIHANTDGALRFAAHGGHLPVVEFLVAHGADIHANTDGALRNASDRGHLQVVEFLVAHGADIHANTDDALRTASYRGHLHVVEFLVAHGAGLAVHRRQGVNILHRSDTHHFESVPEGCKVIKAFNPITSDDVDYREALSEGNAIVIFKESGPDCSAVIFDMDAINYMLSPDRIINHDSKNYIKLPGLEVIVDLESFNPDDKLYMYNPRLNRVVSIGRRSETIAVIVAVH